MYLLSVWYPHESPFICGAIHRVLLLTYDSGETCRAWKTWHWSCSHNILSAFHILQLFLVLETTSWVQRIDVARGSNPQLTEVVEKFPAPSETGLSCSLPSGFGRDAQGGVIDLTDRSLKCVFEVSPSGWAAALTPCYCNNGVHWQNKPFGWTKETPVISPWTVGPPAYERIWHPGFHIYSSSFEFFPFEMWIVQIKFSYLKDGQAQTVRRG